MKTFTVPLGIFKTGGKVVVNKLNKPVKDPSEWISTQELEAYGYFHKDKLKERLCKCDTYENGTPYVCPLCELLEEK